MKSGGLIFIIVGLILFYIVITDKYLCLASFIECLASPNSPQRK
jgi:hypothetical protein